MLSSWNHVARIRDEIVQAHADWVSGSERFGRVDSAPPRIPVAPPPPPWA